MFHSPPSESSSPTSHKHVHHLLIQFKFVLALSHDLTSFRVSFTSLLSLCLRIEPHLLYSSGWFFTVFFYLNICSDENNPRSSLANAKWWEILEPFKFWKSFLVCVAPRTTSWRGCESLRIELRREMPNKSWDTLLLFLFQFLNKMFFARFVSMWIGCVWIGTANISFDNIYSRMYRYHNNTFPFFYIFV